MLGAFKWPCRHYLTKTGVFGHLPVKKKKFRVPDDVLENRAKHGNFYRLVSAYRRHGHKKAATNPLRTENAPRIPQLEASYYRLDGRERVSYRGIINNRKASEGTVDEAASFLQDTYCREISAEFSHLPEEEMEWLCDEFEALQEVSEDAERQLMAVLLESQVFDNFLAKKFSTLKRYGGEGAESMMAFFWQILDSCNKCGISDVVVGMPHRGRLNALTGLFRLPPQVVFRKVKGLPEFGASAQATGDVLSHLTCSVDIGSVHVTMLPNPSHLEAVNPVSMGKARAKQMTIGEGDYGDGSSRLGEKVVNIQVHGDAAFSGQGVNQETISLSGIPHYNVGGVLHIVVNNQLGFTTPPEMGRATDYPTDLAKMIDAPVFHVNGDFPDKVAQVADLALRYQRNFRRDAFINMNCYRQWGHNELDDPTFTNPEIYKIIHGRKTVPDLYAEKLVARGLATNEQVESLKKNYYDRLNAFVNDDDYVPEECYFQRQWSHFVQAGTNATTWDTGLEAELLRNVAMSSVAFPDDFRVHKHLLKSHINARKEKVKAAPEKIDWATAEAMAVGSLLLQGFNVRISGQDVGRGTFSQRHAMFVDQDTGDIYIPLNHMEENQRNKLEIANSPLSEEAVLGFEYGMSIEHPGNLIIWEAQFGDFFNGAQIMIDTFVTSGETKWMKCSGIVMLLPHGYDGAGPEHSSSRIERFLQLTDSSEVRADGDNVNFQVVNPTTPAQYFHVLRRQMIRNYRKPLVVISPKILLRLPEAVSALTQFRPGSHFQEVIDDETTDSNRVRKLIFTSGKHYYVLKKEQIARKLDDVAIVRVESLCPFPTLELQRVLDKYANAEQYTWSQEEPRNMGAWTFVNPRFQNLAGARLRYAGPEELGVPALVGQRHYARQKKVIDDTFQ